MIARARPILNTLYCLGRRFRRDARGNVAIVFAVASTVLLLATGAGMDLSRAYLARQKLSETATLTCQFSMRKSAVNIGANAYYAPGVNQFAANELTAQNWPASSPPTDTQNGTGSNYFTSTGASASQDNQVPTGQTQLWYNMPTTFMKMFGVNQITIHAVMNCQTPAALNGNQNVVTPPPQTGTIVASEGFETGKSGYYFTNPAGQTGALSSPQNTFPATAGYQGDNGSQFYVMGYCLEIDQVGNINSSVPQGTHSAELDCDNGSGSAGNSSISTKTYLPVGNYELRYNYRSRVDYGNYDPVYICGSTALELSWANDNGNGFNGQRTNQINVYFDQDSNSGPPPTHTTIDGKQQLAGGNLIDMCLYGPNWLERSVKIKITTTGYYWLSFAADGNNDSYGGQIDNIRLCVEQCVSTPQETLDNFPSAWLPVNNVNTVLFEDSFEAPTYTTDAYASSPHSKLGNLNLSLGTTKNSAGSCYAVFGAYPTPPGWPCQNANGWATAPYNEVVMFLQGAYQGSQYLTLDGSNIYSTGTASTNRLVSRPFLLVPGYYQVSYDYISDVDFKSTANVSGTYCYAAPSSGYLFPGVGSYPSMKGQNIYQSGTSTSDGSTNIVGAFMAHGQLVSTPVLANATWSNSSNTNISSPSLGGTTSYNNPPTYNNPNGTVTTTPAVPPDQVNWANYNASAVNPVIDTCRYVDSFKWLPRSVYVKISKVGVYWLTFSANGGTADGNGPAIDDVKLSAVGSPFMPDPPTSPLVTIPTPAPTSDTLYTGPPNSPFTGFSIVADPFAPPAADQ